ncbi:MAG TPA: ester cyclase [Anaerolineales bacterium]|nr:ester cyclase [Anaerolineales bacterium]
MNEFVDEQPMKDHISAAEAGFPSYELLAEKMIAEDDLVAVIGRFSGTHTGTFMGIPPTGKSFSNVPIHITYKLENGKIVDHWMLFDTADLMQQLGLVPSAT